MTTIKQTIFGLLIVTISFAGCKKETSNEQKNYDIADFMPSADIAVINGMLVFKTKADMDITMLELAAADRHAVDAWEQKIDIQTPASVFHKVVEAEDSVSKHYKNLSQSEQVYWLAQPQVHSEIYKKALNSGIIKELKEPDGNVYFDFNLSDNSMNSLVNANGFLMVEGKIMQYTPNAIKVILNGDFSLTSKLSKMNQTVSSEDIIVHVIESPSIKNTKQYVDPGFNWTTVPAWHYWDKNLLGNYTKRNRVWIDGHSEAYGGHTTTCAYAVQCTHTIRAEYQEKNFWGNWVYSGNQSFSVNTTWTYEYGRYSDVTTGCGSNPQWYNWPFGAYNCGGATNCPDPPFSYSYPTVNNVYINLKPHGIWYSGSGPWFSDAMNVHGTFSSNLGGTSFNFSY
jgi:hypothetical protein